MSQNGPPLFALLTRCQSIGEEPKPIRNISAQSIREKGDETGQQSKHRGHLDSYLVPETRKVEKPQTRKGGSIDWDGMEVVGIRTFAMTKSVIALRLAGHC